jgi:hypothetical protein
MNKEIDELKVEVKFLRELVMKLMVERAQPVIIREIERNPYPNPQPYNPPYNPYMIGDPMAPYTPRVMC